MAIFNKQYSIFIVGPDKKRLVRDALRDHEFFFFEPTVKNLEYSIKIILLFFLYFFKLRGGKGTIYSLVKSSYLTALIRVKTRHMVVSAIDNNVHLWRAAKLLHGRLRFVTIQNGIKSYDHDYTKENLDEMFFDELLCFGRYDSVCLERGNVVVKKVHCTGSLYEMKAREISKIYQEYVKGNHKVMFDLCLISEDFTNWNLVNPGIEEASGKVAQFCKKYCDENNLKLAIALKNPKGSTKRQSELNFLKRFIDIDDVKITLSENKTWYSSYDIGIQSKLIVGMASSMLLEHSLRKLKVLICDFYGHPWSLNSGQPIALVDRQHSYSKFSKKVSTLLEQPPDEYYKERATQINYFISNEYSKLSDCINSIIGNP